MKQKKRSREYGMKRILLGNYSYKHCDTSLTFVCIAESTSEGAAHSNISVLQIIQH